jgi:hypothetical protein
LHPFVPVDFCIEEVPGGLVYVRDGKLNGHGEAMLDEQEFFYSLEDETERYWILDLTYTPIINIQKVFILIPLWKHGSFPD